MQNVSGSASMDLPDSGIKCRHWIFSSFQKRRLKVISWNKRTESVSLFESRRARAFGSPPPKKSSLKHCC